MLSPWYACAVRAWRLSCRVWGAIVSTPCRVCNTECINGMRVHHAKASRKRYTQVFYHHVGFKPVYVNARSLGDARSVCERFLLDAFGDGMLGSDSHLNALEQVKILTPGKALKESSNLFDYQLAIFTSSDGVYLNTR